ncbi:fatty acid desaturase family protein [Nakamurella lactea]|uniref:fatty acid desaturase family protein n=1 Tax=Nakamurella lactea TaxID=459515 RepID=UPI0004020E69|nr:acyl-CoA desaturase [Nakamurella lactea]
MTLATDRTRQSTSEHRPDSPRKATDYATVMHAVQQRGLLKRRRGYYLAKIVILLALLAGLWVGFSFIGESWAQLGIAGGLAFVLTQLIFLSHDAAHRQIFTSGRWNDWTALVLGTGMGGVSLAWWNNKHSKHHAAPNQIGKDPDIDPSLVHFYLAEKPIRSRWALAMHARQGWWFFPLLLVEMLNLQVQSVVALITDPTMKRRRLELTLITLRLAALPALLFVFLPPGIAATFLGVVLGAMGVYLGASFAVSHIGMPVVPPTEKIDFFHRQVISSRNVLGGRVASFAMGGLNYQIEHHLFPSMPRPNLRLARPVIRDFCLEQGVVYHEVPVYRAWLIVVRYLNQVGIAGRNAYGCPTANSLR